MTPRSFLALCAACCALPAAAVTMRPDRDEAEYLELATRYTSSIPLPARAGEAVLVAPRWLLTAAHRAKALVPGKDAVEIAGRSYRIEAIDLHPQWRPGGANDIALVRLREPVRGVTPTPVYRGNDEAGKTVIVVAHGDPGRIGGPPHTPLLGGPPHAPLLGGPPAAPSPDRRARAAINTIERVTPTAFGLRIKPAEEASDLQGALTAAQAGAAAYLETPEGIFVAGIHSMPEGRDWNLFARASAYLEWIEAVLIAAERDEQDKLLGAGSR